VLYGVSGRQLWYTRVIIIVHVGCSFDFVSCKKSTLPIDSVNSRVIVLFFQYWFYMIFRKQFQVLLELQRKATRFYFVKIACRKFYQISFPIIVFFLGLRKAFLLSESVVEDKNRNTCNIRTSVKIIIQEISLKNI